MKNTMVPPLARGAIRRDGGPDERRGLRSLQGGPPNRFTHLPRVSGRTPLRPGKLALGGRGATGRRGVPLRLAQQEQPRPTFAPVIRSGRQRVGSWDWAESSGHARENRSGATPGVNSTVSVCRGSSFVAGLGSLGLTRGGLYAGGREEPTDATAIPALCHPPPVVSYCSRLLRCLPPWFRRGQALRTLAARNVRAARRFSGSRVYAKGSGLANKIVYNSGDG